MPTPYAFESVRTPMCNMHKPRSFLPWQVQPLHWPINALYNTIPFEGSMDPYDCFSETTNLPSKSSYAPHYIQPQPQQPQYTQPPPTQEINLFDVNAFAALSPSSVGSLTITPSLSPSTILLTTDALENPYKRPSHPVPPPPTQFEATTPRSQAALPVNRAIRRRRQHEIEEHVEEFLPAPKRRRYEHPNSSVVLPSVPLVPGVLSAIPAVTAQSFDADIFPADEQATSWTPSTPPVRKRRSHKRSEDAQPSNTRGTTRLSVIRASSAPLPDSKYGWLDHLLSSALEGSKRP